MVKYGNGVNVGVGDGDRVGVGDVTTAGIMVGVFFIAACLHATAWVMNITINKTIGIKKLGVVLADFIAI
jgi:hypothetical protein